MIRTMFGRLATACCADAGGTLPRKTATASVHAVFIAVVLCDSMVHIRGV